jgi:hypothetical protein
MDRDMDSFSAVQKGAEALLKGIYHGTLTAARGVFHELEP